MTLENWASNRWLEKLESDREEIEPLLANADGHLDDYQKAVASEMSADAQLYLAWDAIRVRDCCNACCRLPIRLLGASSRIKFVDKMLSGCRVFGGYRLEIVQNLQIL